MEKTILKNPILHGFYPDPSICSVNGKFYLVNSTFSYFPGIPVFESEDLVHWKQIGNALNRAEQVTLNGNTDNEGIYAPTIRYYRGKFYIIADHETSTNKAGMFIITAEDPKGPWSDPTYIEGADGIDPSLFMENGHFYFTATHGNSKGSKFFGDNELYLAEIDPESKQLISKKIPLWNGAMRNVPWPEGPHIYKHNSFYYLLIAEAGTESHHAMTIARSKKITGPYEGCPNNPIMTHRFLGKNYPIKNVGHGDFVKSSLGDWYFVCLASEQYKDYVNTGRETFLGKVVWEDDWPVLNPGKGKILSQDEINLLPKKYPESSSNIAFDKEDDLRLIYLKNPVMSNYQRKNGKLHLIGSKNKLSGKESPTFVGIRESSLDSFFTVNLGEVRLNSGHFCLADYQNNTHYVLFGIKKNNDRYRLFVKRVNNDQEEIVYSQDMQGVPECLTLRQRQLTLCFGYRLTNDSETRWTDCRINTDFLSTEVAGGFLGCVCGMYLYGTTDESVNVKSIDTSNSYER